MLHQHHLGCNHFLVLCTFCDVVYCSNCHKEWGVKSWAPALTFGSGYTSGTTVTLGNGHSH